MPEHIENLSLLDAAALMSAGKAPLQQLDPDTGRVVGESDEDDTQELPQVSSKEDAGDDVGTEEKPSPDDDDDSDVDENDDEATDSEETPTIEPPKSYTAAEKAEFAKLPPAMQETVQRRESERDKALLQRMNQVAEERKQIEPHIQKLQHEQQQYTQTIQSLLTMTIPQLREFENVDWVTLARDNPGEYVEKQARLNDVRSRVNFMSQQIEANQTQQQQQQQQFQAEQFKRTYAEQAAKLIQEIPEFGQPETAAQLGKEIRETASRFGFEEAELNQVVDSRIVTLLHHLVQLEKAETTRKSALAKKTSSPATAFMKPNGASPGRDENKGTMIKKAMDRLDKSGDIWDAVRVMTLR